VFAVLVSCAPWSARAAFTEAPVVVLHAPVFVVPTVVMSPALSPALALTPIFAAPLITDRLAAPVPALAAPAVAVTPIAALQAVAAKLGDAAVPAKAAGNEAALNALWNGSAPADAPPSGTPHVVDAIVSGGASPEFIARVKAHLKATMPEPILRDMIADGYRIEVNARVRQGREDLHEDNDYTGGFHSYGPKGKFIIIAEEIKDKKTGEWRGNMIWENAVNHEIGHATAYILGEREAEKLAGAGAKKKWQAKRYATKGISESPAFRAAWRADLKDMPEDLKQQNPADGLGNRFYYFTQPDELGQRGRQETFAEGFDILLRGPASRFNYEIFIRRFPRALKVIRAELERVYGPIFPGH
jgi:hypothetical protein